MKKIVSLVNCLLIVSTAFSQTWVDKAYQRKANFYDVQKEFYDYFKDKDIGEKGNGYKAFKRWEYIVGPRVYPSGDLSLMNQSAKNFEDFLREYHGAGLNTKSNQSALSATWMPVGPVGAPTGSLSSFYGCATGAGRDNCIAFHPTNPQVFYAASAGGGVWQTNNGGATWFTNTDNLPNGACTDIAIDPANPNVIYLATGDGEAVIPPIPSAGVYKSSDGGLTWLATGLTYGFNQGRYIHKLAIDPGNSLNVFAATSAGLYRSTNGGTSWATVGITGNVWDIKFNPGNSSIVYATGNTSFYRSINSGASFAVVTSGIPSSGAQRMSIAVTPTTATYVYVLACKSSDSQLLGVYKSTNDGVSFTTAATSPNLIGNACNGSSTGTGQGWYDLAIAASPITPNEIVVGGVNIWRSLNGGTNWTNIGCWNSPSALFVHADIHELEYSPNGTLYTANDGGIFSYTGSNWIDLAAQRNIAQIYKIGLSSITPYLWLTGSQDNGTCLKNGAAYSFVLGGDGMDCFIDRTNDQTMYGESQNGGLRRSYNGGLSWTNVTSGLTGTPGWVTPWKQDPLNPNTIYCGRNQLFKSNNQGSAWVQMGTSGGGGSMIEFAVAPSNNQVIYTLYTGSIRKTTDGGVTWTNVTNGVPASAPTFITIHPTDPNKAWVTLSGYSAGSKVFQTVDGGASWMNVTGNLPNLPANCSVYEPGSNDRIYIGMDVGIYYKDNSSSNWTLYNAGLPNIMIMDMEISPAVPGQIFAATYGRGVYQADVLQVTAAPSPSFSHYGSICTGSPKALVDNSSNNPTSWSWSITPNTGVTFNSTTVQTPTLTFTNGGTYTISMVSGNGFGSGPVYTQTVLVATTPTLVLTVSNSVTICQFEPLAITASGALTYTWSNGGGFNPSVTYSPTINWTYSVTGSNNGCLSKETVAVTIEECVGLNEYQNQSSLFSVFPNPASDKLNVISTLVSEVTLEITDVSGKTVKEQKAVFKRDKNEVQLNIATLAKGVYFLKVISNGEQTESIKFLKE